MIASTCSRAAWGLHTVAASSMDAAALSTTVCTPCPGFDTLRVFTRCLLSSSVTSLLTADGSRDSAAASAKRGTAFWLISCRSRTRAGVITSRKSAGSSKDRFRPGAGLSSRSSLRALARMREKKRSIDSMPIRILRPRLGLRRFEVLPDFGLETLFRALIGFKLHRFHFSQIMAMVISMRVVVSPNPAVISRSVMGVDQYHRISQ